MKNKSNLFYPVIDMLAKGKEFLNNLSKVLQIFPMNENYKQELIKHISTLYEQSKNNDLIFIEILIFQIDIIKGYLEIIQTKLNNNENITTDQMHQIATDFNNIIKKTINEELSKANQELLTIIGKITN